MKKYLTLNNFLVLFGIVNILLYLAPAVFLANKIAEDGGTGVNLFAATFGGSFTMPIGTVGTLSGTLVACPGLVVAFVFAILAIVLNVLKNKTKLAGLVACPFYLTSGILIACAGALVDSANRANMQITVHDYYIQGGAVAVATIFFIIAAFVLIDFIASIAKPRQQQVAY